jgi:nucleoside-diphosphate-sugar epimerase
MNVLSNIKDKENTVFNFVSSWFVYGNGPSTMEARETDYCDPKGFYSITKRTAEQLLISFCETHKMQYRILRLSNVVGVGDNKTSKKKNAIGHLVNELIQNNPVSLYECGHVYRDLIHVNDCVRAINLILEHGEVNSIYNISNGTPVELRLFIETAKQMINSTSEILCMETPTFHKQVQVESMYLNNEKLKRLGYTAEYNITNIITDLIVSNQK